MKLIDYCPNIIDDAYSMTESNDERTFLNELIYRMELCSRHSDEKSEFDAYVTVLSQEVCISDIDEFEHQCDLFWNKAQEKDNATS